MTVFKCLIHPKYIAVAGGLLALVLATQFAADADDGKPNGVNAKPAGTPPLTARTEGPATRPTGDAESLVPPISEKHPLYLPLQEAYKAREALDGMKEYECEFQKRELIGRRLVKTTMNLKLRQDPFSVYLKFLDAHKGREVIYVDGRNKNNLQVHEVGIRSIVGTLSLSPTGSDAMTDNKYPVTMIGLKTMLDKVITQWEEEGKLGEVQTQKYPNATLPSGEECVAYESSHPAPKKQFRFHTTRLWIEKKTGVAIRLEQLGFPQNGEKPPIIEEYTYCKFKPNTAFTDVDFDIKNPKYAFP